MKTEELLKELKGIKTIKAVMLLMGVDRQKAVYYIHRLRKAGYVKTTRNSDKTRVYHISFDNRIPGATYEEVLNKDSPVKVATTRKYKLYGRTPSSEEVLVYAIKSRSLRKALAALNLFKKIHDWKRLYKLAKENNVQRQVGALYDLARTIMKTRKMSKRFRNNALPKKGKRFEYIVPAIKSDHFSTIENRWKVYLPFNRQDLEDYL
jgi:hypothetical protein